MQYLMLLLYEEKLNKEIFDTWTPMRINQAPDIDVTYKIMANYQAEKVKAAMKKLKGA